MLNTEEITTKLPVFAEEAKLFFHAYGLGNLVVDKPVDHAAIKGLNKDEYNQYLLLFLPLSKRLSYEDVGPRQIAIGELYEPLDCGTFGTVSTIEIMEPKPDAAVTTHDMIDHIELLTTDLQEVIHQLTDKGVEFSWQENPAHNAVVVAINEWGQEVKFTDRPLQDIAEKHIAAGVAKVHQ